jgi:TonB-dependent starch-binding outer membrane protein SusC
MSPLGRPWRTSALAALLLAVAALAPSPSVAQQAGRIQGTVKDSRSARPLTGAQVFIQGTSYGTLTRQDGRYLLLNVPAGTYDLSVQMIGYKAMSQKVTVEAGRAATADFSITASAVALNELVVTGLAAQVRKKAIGTSLDAISSSQIDAAPAANTQQVLQGEAPGVTVMSNSGQPGAGMTVKIRGIHSVESTNAPIIYVDGVRIYNLPTRAGWGGRASTSPLDDIDPADIQRIEVVKGAAATTLYGTEAAAGVIQIFTKRGQSGAPRWNAQLTTGLTTAPHFGAASDPTDLFVNCGNNSLMYGLDTFNAHGPPGYSDKVYFEDPTCPASGHWNRPGPQQKLDLSVRGGTSNVTYYVSGNVSNEDGYLPTQANTQGGFRGNFSFAPTNNFTVNLNSSYTRKHVRWVPDGNNSNGFLLNVGRGFGTYLKGGKGNDCANVPAQTAQGNDIICATNGYLFDTQLYTNNDHFISGLTVHYNPLTNLQNRLTVGWDYVYINNNTTRPFASLRTPSGYFWDENTWHTKLSLDYTGSLTNNLMKGNVVSTFSWGGQIFRDHQRWTEIDVENFAGPGTPTLNSGADITYRNDLPYVITNAGFFGQEQIAWKDRLFVTAGIRVDGNSTFGSSLGLQPSPKVNVSYVLSDYGFWPKWFDTFRLRGAVGESTKAPGPFDKLRTWSPVATGDAQPGFAPQNVGNAALGPERTLEYEGGFDASLLGGRLGLTFTAYRDKTFDMLVGRALPASDGFLNSRLENVGSMEGKGIEMETTLGLLRRKAINWDLHANVSLQSSKVLNLDGDPNTTTSIYAGLLSYFQEGQPAPVYEGSRVMNPNAIADPQIVADTVIGPVYPTRDISIGTTLRLGSRLTLDALAEYQGGHYIANYTAYQNERRGVWQPCYATQEKIIDYYENGNSSALDGVTALQRARCAIRGVGMSPSPDYWIEPANFTKLRHVSLTYEIPKQWLSFTNNASVTLSGINLLTWTKYDGTDPEVMDFTDQSGNVFGGGDYGRRDYYTLPPGRIWTLSFRVSF